jgi:hypothetical protein
MSRARRQATVGRVTADPLSTRDLVGALADPHRLRVVAAVALGARTRAGVVATTGLSQSGTPIRVVPSVVCQ